MRDRLIELLMSKSCKHNKCPDDVQCDDCEHLAVFDGDAEKIADAILADGWMRPPCKVGQTIYYHFQFRNKSILPFTRKAKVKKIYCSNSKMKFVVDVELIDAKEKGIMKSFCFDDFGKTVFLTEKEAEQALRKDVGK